MNILYEGMVFIVLEVIVFCNVDIRWFFVFLCIYNIKFEIV